MKLIILIVVIIVIIVIFYYVDKNKLFINEAIYIKSDFDNKNYLVRDFDDKEEAAYMLSIIRLNIIKLKEYLNSIKDTSAKEFKPYINQLNRKMKDIVLTENSPDGTYTSYTVNKGDEIALCLRSTKDTKLHDINIIMYVVLHELAHVACPEIDHTPLFKKIFIFFLIESQNIDIYKHISYDILPQDYCGITISENLLS